MTADLHPRRRGWRGLRRLVIGLSVIVLLLAFGGYLRGQDQWGPFRGQVVDTDTGAPIANAHVMVTWRIRRISLADTVSAFFDARETMTDAQGRFEIPRLWPLWTLNVLEPGVGFFAPGYIAMAQEVTPADGAPFVDPTVVTMRPLKTQEERCRQQPGEPLHDKAPIFRTAVQTYLLGLRCWELRERAK